MAVKCATLNRVRYDTTTQHYEQYDLARGLWVPLHEIEVTRLLDNLLIDLGHTHKQQWFVQGITAAKLSSLARMLRPHDLKVMAEPTAGLVHVRNGVLDLTGRKRV